MWVLAAVNVSRQAVNVYFNPEATVTEWKAHEAVEVD
jgi:hypothetical protein